MASMFIMAYIYHVIDIPFGTFTDDLQDLATVVPNLEPVGLDLLSVSQEDTHLRPWTSCNVTVLYPLVSLQKMLRFEPNKRITARQALEHEYFKDMEMVQ